MKNHPLDPLPIPPDPFNAGNNSSFARRFPKSWLPQYRVVLLQNADKELMFIVRTIMELTRFCRTEAIHKMWQAHYNGRSVLVVTHQERAELFVELFTDHGLQVAIEPN